MSIFPPSVTLFQPELANPMREMTGSHPLFPLTFNQSAVTFNQPETKPSDGQQLDFQSQQLEQLQLQMDGLQLQPKGVNRSKNRSGNSRRIQQQPEQQKRLESDATESTDRRNLTAIRGPIATSDGNVPVVPLFTVPLVQNGTLLQIPLLWTAMSLAMGVELRGEIIRGLPCIKRLNQLFCPTAGTRYPGDPIERFIDENKALIRRMYGEFQTPAPATTPGSTTKTRRSVGSEHLINMRDAELFADDLDGDYSAALDSLLGTNRTRRQTNRQNANSNSNKSDACESTVEVVTPYWAANSSGKIRAIVNTQHFEQAVHQEVCSKPRTARCGGDCSCEQKYKWHRLLAYDPDNDCKGIFMDWFLFPSCCVCRCLPL